MPNRKLEISAETTKRKSHEPAYHRRFVKATSISKLDLLLELDTAILIAINNCGESCYVNLQFIFLVLVSPKDGSYHTWTLSTRSTSAMLQLEYSTIVGIGLQLR